MKKILKLIVVLVVLCIMSCSVSCSLYIAKLKIKQRNYDARLVLAIRNEVSSSISYNDVSNELVKNVKETIDSRFKNSGIECEIKIVQDNLTLIINCKSEDLERVIYLSTTQGELTFRSADNVTLLTGEAIEDSQAGYDPQTGDPIVYLEFNAEGRKQFALATETIVGMETKTLSIYLDDRLISSPTVNEKIDSNTAQITGIESIEQATTIAAIINSSPLCCEVVVVKETVKS